MAYETRVTGVVRCLAGRVGLVVDRMAHRERLDPPAVDRRHRCADRPSAAWTPVTYRRPAPAIYFGCMPLLRRVGLRWILAVGQSLFCIVLLAGLFHDNRQLRQPGSVFGATSSAPVIVFQELNLPLLFLVSFPKLCLQDRWTSVLDTLQA